MARPRKTALSYFPFDVDFFQDERVVCIAGEFGLKGELVAVKLLCAVYSKGYYAEWNEMVKFKLLKDMPGIKASLLDDIVRRLVKWGFFDKTLFDSAQILTSVEIQETYFEAMKRCVKQDDLPYVIVPPPESASLTGVSATETTVNATNMPQIKEKEKKENKSKAKEGELSRTGAKEAPALGGFEIDSFSPPSEEQLGDAVRSPELQSFGPTMQDARAFKAYYDARGWLINGMLMRDWLAAFRSWLSKKSRFGESVYVAPAARQSAPKEKPKEPDKPYIPPTPEFFEQLNATTPWGRKKAAGNT